MSGEKSAAAGTLSIELRLYLVLAGVFTMILVAYLAISLPREKALLTNIIETQVADVADSYFDSVNVLMLSGGMLKRHDLQEKMLEKPGVIEARIIRADHVNELYGPGFPDQVPVDDLDHAALRGEKILSERNIDGDRVVTSVLPMVASVNHKGTDCLACHQAKEGEVLGAVRVSYSMASVDAQLFSYQVTLVGTLLVVFVIGMGATVFLLRHSVIQRIKYLRETINHIQQNSDLTRRFNTGRPDELGLMMQAFNEMLDTFHGLMTAVRGNASRLESTAGQINANAHSTSSAVGEQHTGIELMAAAANEMEATSAEVKSNAERTAASTLDANKEADRGVKLSTAVIDGTRTLSGQLDSAVQVIDELDKQAQRVGSVLEVIKGIAEQTNLLALNAAIEAARAGESGRGFAVVADEVRSLATKTHQSAEEIETMISRLTDRADNAVSVMHEARQSVAQSVGQVEATVESLNHIAGQVSEINGLNQTMVTISEDQRRAAEEIHQTVLNISRLAEKSASSSADTTRLADDLLSMSHSLNQQVARFRLD